MLKKVRFGILSTAGIAQKALIPAIQRSEIAEVTAIASRSNKVQDIAGKFDIPTYYCSYEELLADENIDAVYIPLPNELHKQWVIEAAKHGKHILCEKPASLTAADVEEMVKVCEEQNVIFMEAFMYQFHPQHNRIKEIIAAGEIGDVKLIRSTFSYNMDLETNNIRLKHELGGGSIYDVGCYCIHASRLITGEEPVQITAKGSIHPRLQVDTSACGILSFESGILASFDCSFEQPASNQYEVVGTDGSILAKSAFRPDVNGGDAVIQITTKDGSSRDEVINGDQYKLQVNHFSECVLERKQPIYSGEDTIKNMKVLEEVVKLARV